MKTEDQISKIKAVALYILQAFKAGADYIHLYKIMYFAQQEHLVTYGMPLMDDSFVVRKHGPVPSLTSKVVKIAEGTLPNTSVGLDDFINSITVSTDGEHQIIRLMEGAVPDMDELSVSDVKVLDQMIAKYHDVEPFALAELSHDGAFKKAQKEAEKTGEDVRLHLVDIAKAGGATPVMVDVIRQRQINKRELECS